MVLLQRVNNLRKVEKLGTSRLDLNFQVCQGVGAARNAVGVRTRPLDILGNDIALAEGAWQGGAVDHAPRGSNTAVCGEVQKGQRPFWDN